LNQCPEHREKAPPPAFDGGRIHTLFVDTAVAVEQVLSWHVDVGEVESAVIDAIEPTLGPIVIPADSWEKTAVVAEFDIEGVNAVILARHDELGEHHCGFSMKSGIADVVLPRPRCGCGE